MGGGGGGARHRSYAVNSGVPGTVENDSNPTAQATVHHPAVITPKNEVSCKFAHFKKYMYIP